MTLGRIVKALWYKCNPFLNVFKRKCMAIELTYQHKTNNVRYGLKKVNTEFYRISSIQIQAYEAIKNPTAVSEFCLMFLKYLFIPILISLIR